LSKATSTPAHRDRISTDVFQETPAIEEHVECCPVAGNRHAFSQQQVVTVLEDWEGRMLWLIVPAAFLVVAVIMGIFESPDERSATKHSPAADELEALLKRLDSAEGMCKAASYPTGKKDLILESIWKLREDVERTVSQWRHGTSIEGVMPALVARASRLETAAETGVVTTPPVADPGDHRRVGPVVVTRICAGDRSSSSGAQHRNAEWIVGRRLLYRCGGRLHVERSPRPRSAESRDESSGWYGGSGNGGGGNGGPSFDGGTGGDW
jgi:hypothetical protein